jgi:hypothetical protein
VADITTITETIKRLARLWHGLSYGGKKQVDITCS